MSQRVAKNLASPFPLILILLTFSLSFSQDTGAPDTVRVGTVSGIPGGKAILTVTGFNDEELAGVIVPLKFPSSSLIADSVSYAGSRLSGASITPVSIDSTNNTLSFGAVYFTGSLPAGDGLFARVYFSIKPTALPETVAIDTLYAPPQSLTFSDPNAQEWVPQFKPGKIIIQLVNPAPVWQLVGNKSVLEGDSLKIQLKAKDLTGEPLTFAALNGPPGSKVIQTSDSTAQFLWVPDFVGPYSSSGSPFKVTFVVSDGINFIRQDVSIFVLNKNRRPVLDLPTTQSVTPGSELSFQVSASDPDNESVTLTAEALPPGAVFDNQNPGTFNWTPTLAQAGLHFAVFGAKDAVGDSVLDTVTIIVSADYILSIADDTAYPGGSATIKINLANVDSIGGFDLRIHFDHTVLTMVKVSRDTTRIKDWEWFTYRVEPDGIKGDVKFWGIADLNNPVTTPPLGPGSGSLIEVTFVVAPDTLLGGISVPESLVIRDVKDNTLATQDGVWITQDQIVRIHGAIHILKPGMVMALPVFEPTASIPTLSPEITAAKKILEASNEQDYGSKR